MNPTVDICIISYKRPELLKLLLSSIANLDMTEIEPVRVIVVDNDSQGSAQSTVEEMTQDFPIELNYYREPIQNISLARNAAVRQARSDYVLFVDDDEIVPVDWLVQMTSALSKYPADAIFGPVDPIFAESAPDWIKSSRIFHRSGRTSGTSMEHGATNNTLVKRSVFSDQGFWFDPEYGLSGGGDMEFFWRLSHGGGRLVWCNEAIAFEHIPKERATQSWLLRRAFRGGQTMGRVLLKDASRLFVVQWYCLALIKIVIGTGKVLSTLFSTKLNFVQAKMQLVGHVGKFMARSRWVYKEYSSPNVRVR